MKTTALTGGQWTAILAATFVGTVWLNLNKMVNYKPTLLGA